MRTLLDTPQARVALAGPLLMVDVDGLVPGVHREPDDEVVAAIRELESFERAWMILRSYNSRPPPDAARRRFRAAATSLGPRLGCVAVALEGAGFRASAFRTFVVGFRALGFIRVPLEIRSSVPDARAVIEQGPAGDLKLGVALDAFFGAQTRPNAQTLPGRAHGPSE